jgi:hypothetical protein
MEVTVVDRAALERGVKMRKRLSVLFSGVTALLSLAVGLSAQTGPSNSGPNDDTGCHFDLSPYLWFAGAHGVVGALDHDLGFHASPGDLLSHIDIGLMGVVRFATIAWC